MTVPPHAAYTALPASGPWKAYARLGAAMAAARKKLGLSAAAAALALHVEPRKYFTWEAGTDRVGVVELHAFARLVGADPAALFALADPSNPAASRPSQAPRRGDEGMAEAIDV